nr:MAG TPA: hypothetical protein [Caudoviricetes sp.]
MKGYPKGINTLSLPFVVILFLEKQTLKLSLFQNYKLLV